MEFGAAPGKPYSLTRRRRRIHMRLRGALAERNWCFRRLPDAIITKDPLYGAV